MLFTSGSTGRPKGVEIPRRAIANFLRSMAHTPGLGPEDRLLAITTSTFDISALELLLPLYVGAQVQIANRETVLDPYEVPADGRPVFITSMVAPILVKGRCAGVTGVDVAMD